MDDTAIPAPVRELTPRVHAAVLAGGGDLAPSTMRIPNAHYTSPVIAEAEMRTTFTAPLLLTPGSAVAEPGSFLALDLPGTPVIVVRAADGRVRVLLNACRHRGATLAEGSGCTRRFTCPYHNWAYDTDGCLVGVPDRRKGFDNIDVATHGLIEFPSEERHGLVWAVLDPAGELDLQHHLGPLDGELEAWGYGYHVAATMELQLGSNWKCALEAFQETYHFPYVHGNSIGPGVISNIVTFDQFGRHHRLGVPLVSLGTDPEPAEGENVSCIYYIYPCTVIATSPLGGEMLQFYPGQIPASSTVRHTVLSRVPLADEDTRAFFKDYVPVIQAVIRDEDAVVLERAGAGIRAGRTDVVLGRNEIGCQAAHRQILADLAGDKDSSAPASRLTIAAAGG